uniref:Uncharacterized protein n=1 Tax=Cyprinus carpio carpio TaxID=630221 RepID=A0A9J8AEU2_CYPCA
MLDRIHEMVQTIKRMLTKSQSENGHPYIALLEYRNTPLDGIGMSPAQLLMGRRLKTKLPTSTTLLTPKGSKHKQIQEKLTHNPASSANPFSTTTKGPPFTQATSNVPPDSDLSWCSYLI